MIINKRVKLSNGWQGQIIDIEGSDALVEWTGANGKHFRTWTALTVLTKG